ncbi:translation initiation factor IF-2 [Candidatus Woesearchaeota archaeon]|jgi:translation initiation factor 5B|nr:translation initiation factor IF-2 [Candidatus Woesearchaeota archaeon]
MAIRSPICSVLGHVDHGKSSILDCIRGTCIIATEAGAITQAIGASIIPLSVIKNKCGDLLKAMNMDFTIPGLLFIDTPGHAAFSSLRKRGGNLADIAILVVDINEGFKPQTIESIEILKFYKTPFIIAANKLDLVSGWKSNSGPVMKNLTSQQPSVITEFENKFYTLVGKISEFGFDSDRFDRVADFTKQIGIVPVSAKTGEGISELMMMITGLAQRFLGDRLEFDSSQPAKGTILEVKEEKGLGKTMDVIVYDGTLKVNDSLVIGGVNGSIITKVRALMLPADLAEMRDKKTKFKSTKEVVAATGVKISCPDMNGIVAGMPVRSCDKKDTQLIADEMNQELNDILVQTDKEGIIIKADTIGSLEALSSMLRDRGVTIRKASVGDISKKDVIDAESNLEQDPLSAVILAFNLNPAEDVIKVSAKVKILANDIIYKLIENYEAWLAEEKRKYELEKIGSLTRPCKLRLIPNYIFRQSNPAIVGVDLLIGKLSTNVMLMKENGVEVALVKSIQKEKDSVQSVDEGSQVAISLPGVTVGRQIVEGENLFVSMPEKDFIKLKEFKELLSNPERELLKEIAMIKREQNPVWGI